MSRITSGAWRDRDVLAFRSYKFNSQTDYVLSGQSKASLSGGLVYMNPHDGPMVGAGSSILNPAVKLPYANLSYENQGFFLRAYWNGFFADTAAPSHPLLDGFVTVTDPTGSPDLRFRGNTYNIEGQHSTQISESGRLTYGINYRYNTFSCNCVSTNGDEHRLGMYVQGEWAILPSINVIGGLRYDLHTQINPTYSPRLALVYTPVPGHTLRVQASVGYRPPTLFESYQDARITPLVPNPFFPVSNPVLGSRNLQPERILSYELGYQGWFFRHRVRVRADLFFNRTWDLIGQESTPTMVNTVNSGKTGVYGGETGVEWQATSWLTGFVNYSFQEIENNTNGHARRGAPQSKANAGLRGEWESGLSGDIVLHYVGAAQYPIAQSFDIFAVSPGNRVDSYTLLNLRAGYRVWERDTSAGYRQSAEIAVAAFNVSDDHREHPLGDVISRRIIAWLTLKL